MAHRHIGMTRILPSATRISSSAARVTIVASFCPRVDIASRSARTSRSRVAGSSIDAHASTRPYGVTKSTS